ncbi:MAG: hypothetical protein JXB03_08445 [Spirochaetales bacterium]|nr:hypothetical protein [Spirochaetales bacterium]
MNTSSLINDRLTAALTGNDPWTAYRTLTDILGKDRKCTEAQQARKAVLENPFTQKLMSSLSPWYRDSITRHNNPEIPIHILKLLAELGIHSSDEGMKEIIDAVELHTEQGLYASRQTLPKKSFKPPSAHAQEWHALPCDSPVIASALWQMGCKSPLLKAATEQTAKLWKNDTPWFCHFFFVEGQFKHHNAACPMAGLMALDLFSRTPYKNDDELIQRCFHPIVYHKDLGKSLYYFGRSKKFWTFKFPFVWYNALYLADVLTRYPALHDTPLVKELVDWVTENRAEDGTWKPTSVFRPYKDLDFGQKKQPSLWITYLCLRILKQRYGTLR